jgi:NTE family protein
VAPESPHPNELGPAYYHRGERDMPAPKSGVGLSLSGGGYRAMLFHAGALWRLNEAGWLAKLDRVSCVSGGSIAGAVLALHWEDLDFDPRGRASNFRREVVDRLFELPGRRLDVRVVLTSIFTGRSAAARLARAYRGRLFGDATLGDLPTHPRFVFNTTNLLSGTRWSFASGAVTGGSGRGVSDRSILVGDAVAASSAFPPFLSPLRPRMTNRPVLTDGGVYDNMGLDETWKHCRCVLISDGGKHLEPKDHVRTFWIVQSLRTGHVVDNQVRALRKRQAVTSYEQGQREGAYWGIRSQMGRYPTPSPLECPSRDSLELAAISTRLSKIAERDRRRLVNWGYAIVDAAMRSHLDTSLPDPEGWPYEGGVGRG